MQSAQCFLTLPCRHPLHCSQVCLRLPCGHGVQIAQWYLTAPWGQGVQVTHILRMRPCGHPTHCTQYFFTFPCGHGVHSLHSRLTLPCGHALHSLQSCFALPCEHPPHWLHPCFSFPCGHGEQVTQFNLSFPCGHGLQCAHEYFTLPCGHGVQSLHCLLCLPCGHPTHSTQYRFTLPCTHPLHWTHSGRRVPCGHGLQITQSHFSLSCGHRFRAEGVYDARGPSPRSPPGGSAAIVRGGVPQILGGVELLSWQTVALVQKERIFLFSVSVSCDEGTKHSGGAARPPSFSQMGPPVRRQATLHQLGKVQTSRSSSYYNVNIEDVESQKQTLLTASTSRTDFVSALRQLSSMLLTKDLLERSMIGVCVNKIAKKHPDIDMRTLAKGIVEKWRTEVREQVGRDTKKARGVAGWRKPAR